MTISAAADLSQQGSCLMTLPSSEFSCCQGKICPYKFGVCCGASSHCCAPGSVCLPAPSPLALAALNLGKPAVDPQSPEAQRPVCGAPRKDFSAADAAAAKPIGGVAAGAAASNTPSLPVASPAASVASNAAPIQALGDLLTERLSKLPDLSAPASAAASSSGAAPVPCPVSCRRYHRRCLVQDASSVQMRGSSLCRASLIPPCCRARLLAMLRARATAAGGCPCASGASPAVAGAAGPGLNGILNAGAPSTFAATSLINSCPCAGATASVGGSSAGQAGK